MKVLGAGEGLLMEEGEMPGIEILHWQEREEECGFTVFLDGVEVEATIFEVNPMRGSSRSRWDESTDFLCSMASPSVARVLRDARADAAKHSPYVEEDNGNGRMG